MTTVLNMRRIIGLAILILSAPWCNPAQASLKTIEQAFEVQLSQLVRPGPTGGPVIVRRCTTCKPESVTITAETRWFVRPGRTPIALKDWLTASRTRVQPAKAMVYVYYSPATRRVTRIVLDPLQR